MFDLPAIRGRVSPSLVEPIYNRMWANGEHACVINGDAGNGHGVYDQISGNMFTRSGVDGAWAVRVDPNFGPTVSMLGGIFTGVSSLRIPVVNTGNRHLTWGGVVALDTVAAGGFYNTDSSANVGFRAQISGSQLVTVVGGVAIVNTVPHTLLAGVPYFMAFSRRGSTPFTSYACVRRLDTGEMFTNTVTGTSSYLSETSADQSLGNLGFTDSMMDGVMAMSFASNCYTGPEFIDHWAHDPFGIFREVRSDGLGLPTAAAVGSVYYSGMSLMGAGV